MGRCFPTEGLCAVAVHHRLSRRGDPHLHSHVLVANRVATDAGVRPLDHSRLRRQLGPLELAYRTALAAELVALGIGLQGVGLGPWRVVGLDAGLAPAFSHRRAEVLRWAGEGAGARRRGLAALATRPDPARSLASLEELRPRWRAQALEARCRAEPTSCADPAPVRGADGLLGELVAQVAQLGPGAGLDAVVEASLRRTFGAARARGLLAGAPVVAAGMRLRLEGTVGRRYGMLPLQTRLELAGLVREVSILPVRSRDAVVLVDELRARLGREVLRISARSESEAALLGRVGGFRDGRHPLTVVVDADRRSPSELARLLARPERLVLCERGVGMPVSPARRLVCEVGGRCIELFGSLEEALVRTVELAAAALAGDGTGGVLAAVDEPALARRVREGIARRLGVDASEPLPGERVELAGGRTGVLHAVRGGRALVKVGDDLVEVPCRDLRAAGIVAGGSASVGLGREPARDVGVAVVASARAGLLLDRLGELGRGQIRLEDELRAPRGALGRERGRWREAERLRRELLRSLGAHERSHDRQRSARSAKGLGRGLGIESVGTTLVGVEEAG